MHTYTVYIYCCIKNTVTGFQNICVVKTGLGICPEVFNSVFGVCVLLCCSPDACVRIQGMEG